MGERCRLPLISPWVPRPPFRRRPQTRGNQPRCAEEFQPTLKRTSRFFPRAPAAGPPLLSNVLGGHAPCVGRNRLGKKAGQLATPRRLPSTCPLLSSVEGLKCAAGLP